MTLLPRLPQDVVSDLVLRALRLEAPICDISAVCSVWHSVVVRHLADVLILRANGNMVSVLRRALQHNKLDVALDLVSRTRSLDESEEALVLVAQSGQSELVRSHVATSSASELPDLEHGSLATTSSASKLPDLEQLEHLD
eukprot:gene3572-biopygen21303